MFGVVEGGDECVGEGVGEGVVGEVVGEAEAEVEAVGEGVDGLADDEEGGVGGVVVVVEVVVVAGDVEFGVAGCGGLPFGEDLALEGDVALVEGLFEACLVALGLAN